MREKIFTIDTPLKAGVSLSSQRSLKISCNLPNREGTFEFSRSNLETSLIPVLLLLIKVRTRFEKQRKKLENAGSEKGSKETTSFFHDGDRADAKERDKQLVRLLPGGD